MAEFLAGTFIVVWFLFWGYILVTNPAVFFKFQEQGDQRLRSTVGGLGKAALFGLKRLKK